MLPDIVTKKRNKLASSTVNALCVVKFALKCRKETAYNMVIDKRHLCLMSSKTLYYYEKPGKKQLNIFGCDNIDPYEFLLDSDDE